MEIKESVYTLKTFSDFEEYKSTCPIHYLRRDNLRMGCPFGDTYCGEWCPAFVFEPAHTETTCDTHTGLIAGEIEVPSKVVLRCFPQPVSFVIKEDQDEPANQD